MGLGWREGGGEGPEGEVDPDDVNILQHHDLAAWPNHVATLRNRGYIPGETDEEGIAHLRALAEITFVAFETTVLCLAIGAGHAGTWAPYLEKWWALLRPFDGLPFAGDHPDWTPGAAAAAGTLVWTACCLRYLVALGFERWILPSYQPCGGRFGYWATLFRDTHLDLFVHAALVAERGVHVSDDRFWLSGPLTEKYPLPHRVLCGDELPDLASHLIYSDLAYDTGKQNKKKTLMRVLVHLFMSKPRNQICHIRHLSKTILASMDEYVEVPALYRLVILTTLLGNFPESTRRPGLAARIRFMCSLSKTATSDEALRTWTVQRKYTVMFLLREWMFYSVESTGLVDGFLSRDKKWRDFKIICRQTTGDIRAELAAQVGAGEDGFRAPLVWDGLEKVATRGGGGGGAAAAAATLVKPRHAAALNTCRKLRKGDSREIILKKMVGVRSKLMIVHLAQLFVDNAEIRGLLACRDKREAVAYLDGLSDTSPLLRDDDLRGSLVRCLGAGAAGAWPDTVATLQLILREHFLMTPIRRRLAELGPLFHKIAMVSTDEYRERGRPPLRWLRLLGLTTDGYEDVVTFFFMYDCYAQADNRYKKWALALGKRNLLDFAIVELYLRSFDSVAASTISFFFLPLQYQRQQASALISRLGLLPTTAPPHMLGRCVFCETCLRFETAVQNSPLWVRCKYDRRLITEEYQRYVKANHKMELTASDHIHKFVPQGHTTSLFNPLTGGQYCPRAPKSKQELQRQRLVAKATAVPTWQRQLEERVDVEGAAAAAAAAAIDAPTAAMTQLYTSMMPPPPTVGVASDSCRVERLSEALMMGVIMKVGAHQLYGLCCYCGDLMHVSDEKCMTNGMSCMNHPHVDDFAGDHYQAIAFVSTTNPLLGDYGRDAVLHPGAAAGPAGGVLRDPRVRTLYRHPHVLDKPVTCDWCRRRQTRCVLHVYDAVMRLSEFAICEVELAALKTFLGPSYKMGQLGAGKPIEFISLGALVERLTAVTRRLVPRAALAPAPPRVKKTPPISEEKLKALAQHIRQTPVPLLLAVLDANPMLGIQYTTAETAPPAARLVIYTQVLEALGGV